MRIVDVHAHVYPSPVAPRVGAWIEKQLGLPLVAVPSPEGLLAHMDASGVDAAAVFNVALTPDRVRSINDWIVTIASPRLIPFGTLHPRLPRNAIREELERLRDRGVRGLKLHSELQQFHPLDPGLHLIYEEAREDFVFLFHCGAGRFKDSGAARATAKDFAEVARRFPRLRMVLAHLGGPDDQSGAAAALTDLPTWFDTSRAPGLDSLPRSTLPTAVRRYGAERLLFGTDFPLGSQRRDLEFLRGLGLPAAHLDQILGLNAETLLRLPAEPRAGHSALDIGPPSDSSRR